jgi:ABC-type lipoprotein export system ATPase subunit
LRIDSERGAQVVDMLAEEIKGKGKAGIKVTHDLRMVDHTDRAISISDGALMDGAPAPVTSIWGDRGRTAAPLIRDLRVVAQHEFLRMGR